MSPLYVALPLALGGCARHYPAGMEEPYGFLSAIWHGLILTGSVVINLLSWALSLVGISFLEYVQIIGRPNTGFGYWAGFVLAVCAVGGGGSRR